MAENKKSAVWAYFELNNDKTRTICQLCRTSLVYTGSTTSSMRSHLAFKHPSVSLSNPVKHGPKKLAISFEKKTSGLTSAQTEDLTRKLALMCAIDLKPISMVDGVGFQYFVKELNPDFKVPCRKTVSQYLQKMYEEEKTDLISTMTGFDVALTSDVWTSVTLQGYITVTGHFITKDWDLISKVLATRVVELPHTGSSIASEITQIKDEFEINTCPALVTGNVGNMLVASKELNIPHVSCFAHALQLGIEDGLKIPQISKVLGAARKLVSHFSHSVLATDALLGKQHYSQSKLKLVQDVPTWWHSSYVMLERLLKLRVAVYAVIFDDTITKPSDRIKLDIKDNFWKILEDIVPILEPLAEITEILSKEDKPTGSSVYVLLHNMLQNVLNSDPEDSGVVTEMKQKVRGGLQKRFKLTDQGEPTDEVLLSPLLLASILDPRYKSLLGREILSSDKVEVLNLIVTDLMGTMGETANDMVIVKQEPETSTPPKKAEILRILQGDAIDSTHHIREMTVQEELSDYMKEPVTVSDPLKWWQGNEGKFPRLGKLAKVYLAIPATSVPSERTFSVAGKTASKLRASLDSDSVDQVIFLNKNMKDSIRAQLRPVSDEYASLA